MSKIEEAMQERAAEACTAADARFPGLRECLVSINDGRCIVEVKQKNGKWTRFEHTTEVDVLAATAAEEATQVRHVKQGKLV